MMFLPLWFQNYLKSCRDAASATSKWFITDIELRRGNDYLLSLIHYRAIGSRKVKQASASQLKASRLISGFSHQEVQVIMTLAKFETLIPQLKALIPQLKESYEAYARVSALRLKTDPRFKQHA